MLNAEKIKLEARLQALEYLTAKLFMGLMAKQSDEVFDRLMTNYAVGLESQTIPGADAATADLITSEIRDAVLSVLNFAKEMRQQGQKS